MNLRVPVLALACAFFSEAQPPQGPPRPPVAWWENPVANGLELTDAQRERVDNIRKGFNERLVQKREAAERAERELDAIFNAPKVDWESAKAAVDQLAIARRDLTRDLAWMMVRMRDVLTLEQWKTLEARRQDPRDLRSGKGRGRGPRPGFSETKQ